MESKDIVFVFAFFVFYYKIKVGIDVLILEENKHVTTRNFKYTLFCHVLRFSIYFKYVT